MATRTKRKSLKPSEVTPFGGYRITSKKECLAYDGPIEEHPVWRKIVENEAFDEGILPDANGVLWVEQSPHEVCKFYMSLSDAELHDLIESERGRLAERIEKQRVDAREDGENLDDVPDADLLDDDDTLLLEACVLVRRIANRN